MSVNGEEKPAATEEANKSAEEAPPPPSPAAAAEEAPPPPVAAEEKKPTEEKKPAEEKPEEKKVEATENKPEANGEKKPEENGTEKKLIGFKERFKQFSKFGDTKSDGKLITLSQSDKWMKQAKVIDKKITTTDTGIHFKKFKMQKISLPDYEKFLEDLAKSKKVEVDELKKKMIECGAPGLTSTAGAKSAPSTVERLTDPSKYTGSHKQRFDETGKGKGIAGRKDTPDKSGYVQGYQNKDSYDKTH